VAPALSVRDAAPRVFAAGLVACLLGYGLSRVSGLLAESVTLPAGAAVFVVGVGLTARSPREYGWRWGRTREHVRFLVAALVATVFVVRLFVARWLPGPPAAPVAVVVSGLALGVRHLGNLGYVPTSFVLVQAVAATVFGLLAAGCGCAPTAWPGRCCSTPP
jgi:hypothetical protein